MKKGLVAAFIVTLAILGYAFKKPVAAPAADTIKWMSWEEVQQAQKKEPRKVFVDVYTEWCGWCKRMDATTFTNKEIVSYINNNYYAVKFDAETRASIKLNGKEYKYISSGYRGYNELAAELLQGQLSYPTGVYLDENLDIITITPGYQEPKQFEQIINFISTGSYKTVSFDDYIRTFNGKVQD